mmetsp:Transcript_9100/g.18618  ORF Transcript_9100/g.18618 Transcript_9100/m.18618 type:complete len:202 (+) Transcript_9100:525-1130(+)
MARSVRSRGPCIRCRRTTFSRPSPHNIPGWPCRPLRKFGCGRRNPCRASVRTPPADKWGRRYCFRKCRWSCFCPVAALKYTCYFPENNQELPIPITYPTLLSSISQFDAWHSSQLSSTWGAFCGRHFSLDHTPVQVENSTKRHSSKKSSMRTVENSSPASTQQLPSLISPPREFSTIFMPEASPACEHAVLSCVSVEHLDM